MPGTPKKPHRENEIKLLAGPVGIDVHAVRRSAEAADVELDDGRTISQRDVYLDDVGFHLGRAGTGLRIRRSANGTWLELKVERGRDGRLRQRDEIALPLTGQDPARRAHRLPKPLRDRVEPFVYDERLRDAVILRVERTRHEARARESAAEVCIDRVSVESPHGDAIGSFEELEIEVQSGSSPDPWLAWAEALRIDAGLLESAHSKLHRALLMARTDVAGHAPTPIERDLHLREAALRIVEQHFRKMQREEVRVRTSDKPAAVHRLRVACRRIRSTFEIFGACFASGEIDAYLRAARRTAKAFQDVRDLDVLTERLERDRERLPESLRAPARRLIRRLREGRDALCEDGRRKLRKARRLADCGSFQRWLEKPRPAQAKGPRVVDSAPELVWHAARHVFASGQRIRRDSPPEHLHELRIAVKRLRYTAEAFADVYGRDLARFIERTTHLQEVLGAFQDATVGVTRLAALGRIDDLPRQELCVVGAWMALEQERGRRAREAFEGIWAEFDTDDLRTYLGAALRAPA